MRHRYNEPNNVLPRRREVEGGKAHWPRTKDCWLLPGCVSIVAVADRVLGNSPKKLGFSLQLVETPLWAILLLSCRSTLLSPSSQKHWKSLDPKFPLIHAINIYAERGGASFQLSDIWQKRIKRSVQTAG